MTFDHSIVKAPASGRDLLLMTGAVAIAGGMPIVGLAAQPTAASGDVARFADKRLAQNDVPASEVKFASLGNDPERYKALLGGIALATVISIEFLPIGKTDGIKLVARGSEVMPKYLRLCAVTTGKLLDARREDAVRFLAAQMQGYNYALANRDEELRITREIAGIKAADPRPEFMFAEAARADTGIDPRMPIPMDKLEWLQQQLVKAGNLSQPFDVSRVVNGDIRAQALARAGLPR